MLYDTIAAYEPKSAEEEAERAMMLDYIRRFPETILLRENRMAHMTASSLILSADGQWVLMAHHNIYKVWAWTGGHADGDSDLLRVVLREAEEETGVAGLRPLSADIASLEILPVWGHMKRGEYVPSHLHLNVSYLLTADRDSPLKSRPEENSAVAWLPAGTLLEHTNEWQMDPVYTKLLQRGRELLRKERQ